MNKELFMVVLPGLSAILFALGGTDINGKGRKWIRRYILPLCFMVACLIGGVSLWQSALVALLGVGAFSLGYGESKNWIVRSIVFGTYGLITMPIGISLWNLIVPIIAIVFFYLSNRKPTSQIVVWKVVESSVGFIVGVCLAYLLLGNGIIW